MYDEKFSGMSQIRGESEISGEKYRFFFSSRNVSSCCGSNFRGDVHVLLLFSIWKRNKIKNKCDMQNY
jgi:hypothetical protein